MQQSEPELTRGQILAESIGKTLESVIALHSPYPSKADLLKVGRPVTSGTQQLHINLADPTLKQIFRVKAAEDGLSMNKAVFLLIKAYVDGKLDLSADQ